MYRRILKVPRSHLSSGSRHRYQSGAHSTEVPGHSWGVGAPLMATQVARGLAQSNMAARWSGFPYPCQHVLSPPPTGLADSVDLGPVTAVEESEASGADDAGFGGGVAPKTAMTIQVTMMNAPMKVDTHTRRCRYQGVLMSRRLRGWTKVGADFGSEGGVRSSGWDG